MVVTLHLECGHRIGLVHPAESYTCAICTSGPWRKLVIAMSLPGADVNVPRWED